MPNNRIILDNDLSDLSVADVLERLEAGKCGHHAVMDYLAIDSYDELVSIMHYNGRIMPGHRPMIVTPETLELIELACRPLPPETPSKAPMSSATQPARGL
jgi:hypothetical protein